MLVALTTMSLYLFSVLHCPMSSVVALVKTLAGFLRALSSLREMTEGVVKKGWCSNGDWNIHATSTSEAGGGGEVMR